AETFRTEVGHRETERMMPGGLDEGTRNGFHQRLASDEGVGSKFEYGLARLGGGDGCGHRLAEGDANGEGDPCRPPPEKIAARKSEDRARDAVDVNGNDRHVRALEDAFHAATERHHLADSGHLAFGKNADELAILQRASRFTEGMDHFTRALIGSDGNH